MSSALLVPIHLDALVLENEETVLSAMADFSKLPYYDTKRQQNINADVPYLSEEIVSHPFRDQSLRLGRGVHLHWALPDALTQGVNTAKELVFPAVPDRWLVTRSGQDGEMQKQWIVESDYLHPEEYLVNIESQDVDKLDNREVPDSLRDVFKGHGKPLTDKAKLMVQKAGKRWRITDGGKQYHLRNDDNVLKVDPEDMTPRDTVTFPLPPRPGMGSGQPYRYLGRKWLVGEGKPKGMGRLDYLNALTDDAAVKTEWHQAVSAGLTALGYGEPAFAAFYPNCRSIFGLHDPEITTLDDFKTVRYDVIGWYDQPQRRDCLGPAATTFAQTRKAIAARIRNEYEASGHDHQFEDASIEIWEEAVAHHFGWTVSRDPDAEAKATTEKAERVFCYARVSPDARSDFEADPALASAPVTIAVGNSASEALSAYLARSVPGNPTLIEKQLEALDLDSRLEHRQIDLGPKFSEARHGKGFTSIRSGVLWTVRLERDASEMAPDEPSNPNEKGREVQAQTWGTLPIYLAHALNDLNQTQDAFQRAQADMDSLRLQIYHDWTLYMRAMRPPEGLESAYPDPIEIARFIEKSGLRALQRKLAATGEFKLVRESGTNTPIVGADVPAHFTDAALASKVRYHIDRVVDGLKTTNGILNSLRLLDLLIAEAQNTGSAGIGVEGESGIQLHILTHGGAIRSANFDAQGKRIVTACDHSDSRIWDAESGEELLKLSGHGGNIQSAYFDRQGKRVVTASRDGTARIWDAESGEELLKIDSEVMWANFDPKGKRVVTGCTDKIARIWDAESGGKLLEFIGHENHVRSASFDPEGERVVTASSDKTARVWDAKNGSELLKLSGHEEELISASFDPKGERVVTASFDGTARIWDAKSGAELLKIDSKVMSANFDPKGRRVVTANNDNTVRIWDAENGMELLTLSGHRYPAGTASFDPTGEYIVTGGRDNTARVWVLSVEVALKALHELLEISYGQQDSLQMMHKRIQQRIHQKAADSANAAEHKIFRDELEAYLPGPSQSQVTKMRYQSWWRDTVLPSQPQVPKMRYALRQVDAPRFYQPTDPVVLMAGEDLTPTDRHGMDGIENEDGKLVCKLIPIEDFGSTSTWDSTEIPTPLAKIRDIILREKPDGDQIGARSWRHQPWHPFMMEWQVEMMPTRSGSNREEHRHSYADTFIAQNYSLREAAVDLNLVAAASDDPGTADSAIYSGSCVLTDHAPGILLDKLNRYLERAGTSDEEMTAAIGATVAQLTAVRDFMALRPHTLSQALDGFHAALVQRHQILQLPIADPIGFSDMKPFTHAVRMAAQGRHASLPLRDNDFTPIRSGTMTLRQLRLVDTFGRVKPVLAQGEKQPIIPSEVMRVADAPDQVNLPPRLLQPARINFRWLSAETVQGAQEDEPETNAHPAFTPVCGWLLPNNLDNSLMVYDNKGAALGTIVAVDGSPAWQPAPGSHLPHWEIEKANSEINPHLRRLINTIVNELGRQDPLYLTHLMATLTNALENIAPEDFSHHESLALLMGRPMAVVRAMVNLEVQGCPVANQSLSSFIPDMMQAMNSTSTLGQAPSGTGDRSNDGFTQVRFPIRIGEDQQLNDGLVGYFLEEADGRYKDNTFFAPQAAAQIPLELSVPPASVQNVADQLDLHQLPGDLADHLEQPWSAAVTIDKTGQRWRIDTEGHVYHVVRNEEAIELFELLNSKSDHIQIHWKGPINLMQSLDDPPQKLTMLVDPQGSVHAVSGILPTKSITIPTDQFADILRKLEITFLSTPILTEQTKTRVPLAAEAGYAWSWLTRRGAAWTETDEIDRIDTRATFHSRQRIVEGWLKLKKTEE